MLRRAFSVGFIVGMLVVGSRGQDEAHRNLQAFIARTKVGSLRPLLEVLDKANLSGSLEFSGRCESLVVQDFPEFPKFRAPATSGGSPLQTLREMFADDPAMQVTQDPDGTIRMIERGVPKDILNVWISYLPFGDGQAGGPRPIYSANIALMGILGAPEVEVFMKAHHIEWPFLVFGPVSGIFDTVPPAVPPDVPQLWGPLDHVTFSGAMDYVLKAFPGVWFYENCPRSAAKKGVVYFRFYHLEKTGSGPIVQ